MIFNLIAGSGGEGWTPASLFKTGDEGFWLDGSDMSTMWQDASKTTQVTATGQSVAVWANKITGLASGNKYDLSISNATQEPLFNLTSGVNNLYFDGVDDSLIFINTATTLSIADGLTTAVGMAFNASNSFKELMYFNTGGVFYGFQGFNGKVVARLSDKSIQSSNSINYPSYNVALFSGKPSTNALSVVLNDTTSTSVGTPASGSLTFNSMGVPYNNTDGYTMRLSQFIMIDRLLTTTEKANLTAFIKSKSGL